MASIERRTSKKDGVHYRAKVRLRGFPPQSASFKRKTDAKRWAQQTEVEIRNGRYFRSVESRRRTVGELVDRYLTAIQPSRDAARMLGWWKVQLGCYTLAALTPSRIAGWKDKLLAGESLSGRKVTPATCNRYLAALSHACTMAVKEWEWLDHNPVRRVRRPSEPRGRVRFLSDDERGRLLEGCQKRDSRLYALVVVAISTGARRGELMALRWPDIDLRQGRGILHKTKNKERRAIPLTGLALEIMRERAKVRRIDTDLVFANDRGVPKFPRKIWDAVLRDVEIDDFRFHDLRHTAASYLAMNGASLIEIAAILGHKTLAMVQRYSHLTDDHSAEVVARMNRAIFSEAVVEAAAEG